MKNTLFGIDEDSNLRAGWEGEPTKGKEEGSRNLTADGQDQKHRMDKLEDAISQGDSKGLEALQRLWAPHCHKLLLPKSKKTLLMLAARHGRVLCTKFLLLTSASGDVGINDQTRNGFTALHYAAYHGNADVVWLLLEAGADTNVRDNEGEDAR